MKANPLVFVCAQFATYVDDSTGKQRWRDHAIFHLLPVIALIALRVFTITVPSIAAVGILTVTGFLSAFLFGGMLQVSQRALDWLDEKPTPSEDTTEHAEYLRQLAANTGYASLVSICTAAVFVVAAASKNTETIAWATAFGFALVVHLTLVLLMVMNRVLALTDNRLIQAETGGPSVTRISSRPRRIAGKQDARRGAR
ncbi:MAG TPA: hypothetical protein VMB51_09455 [Solirubrobacteraceae bacterium]|nr:hypothetical protein [Solirubrobacteraceae bacterium]